MPRSNFDKYARPRTDPLKGLILSAARDQKKSREEMAKMAGVSRNTYGNMLNAHSDTWPLRRTLDLCKGLRIPIEEVRPAIRY